jgi:hypothetical protein
MYEQVERPKENKSRAVGNSVAQQKSNGTQGNIFVDNRERFTMTNHPQRIINKKSTKETDELYSNTYQCGFDERKVEQHGVLQGYFATPPPDEYWIPESEIDLIRRYIAEFHPDRHDIVQQLNDKNASEKNEGDHLSFVTSYGLDMGEIWKWDNQRQKTLGAVKHLSLINEEWNNFASKYGGMLRGIPGGGAFTSKRNMAGRILVEDEEVEGDVHRALSSANIETLMEKTALFYQFTEILANRIREDGPTLIVPIFRSMRVNTQDQLIQDILPSSCSFSLDFVAGWATGKGQVILHIDVPLDFQMVMLSYPMGVPDQEGAPPAKNQEQMEVVLAPSQYTITDQYVYNGVVVLRVSPTLIPLDMTRQTLSEAFEFRKKSELAESSEPTVFNIEDVVIFEEDIGNKIDEHFGSDAIEVLKSATNTSSKVVQDLTGRKWQTLGEYESQFGSCKLQRIE